jgi:hypothetical protein
MKIRNGFVSNSSSSSFLIFGKSFDNIDFLNNNDKVQVLINEDYDTFEIMESIFPFKGNLEWHMMEYDDTIYVGQSWDNVKDDETGLQFKQRTVDELNKLCGTNYTIKDLRTLEES